MLLFSLPKFFHLQNKHNYVGSHFLKKIINLYWFPTNHATVLWLIQFYTLLDDYFILLFLSSTDSTVDLASYFAKKKRDISARSHHHIITPLTCSPSMNEFSALNSGQLLHLWTRSILSPSFKDITPDLSLLSYIIMYLFPHTLHWNFLINKYTGYISSTLIKSSPDPLSPSSCCPVGRLALTIQFIIALPPTTPFLFTFLVF